MNTSLLFQQLFDQASGTYTYLLADRRSKEAVLIDCVFEQHARDVSLLRELDLKLVACLETHCHADHVTGAWLMRHALGSRIVAGDKSGIAPLDQSLRDGDAVKFGGRSLSALETPGHTDGCVSYALDDRSAVFTGDCLLVRGCGRTDFQQGSAQKLFHSIKDKLFHLPDECVVYPGHDYLGRTVSTIGEEKRFNPRIGGEANEGDFVGYMNNMRLPHPKQMDVAVPANLQAGRPSEDRMPQSPTWAPVVMTYSGVWEAPPQWVAAHLDDVHILDVRARYEIEDEGVYIDRAQVIPLDELRTRVYEVPKDKPVMTICRSGRRSALALMILRNAGFERVASIQGGLLRWQSEGLPTQPK